MECINAGFGSGPKAPTVFTTYFEVVELKIQSEEDFVNLLKKCDANETSQIDFEITKPDGGYTGVPVKSNPVEEQK